MHVNYISDRQLAERFGVDRATIWRWARTDKSFPHPIKLSAQTARWRSDEVDAWENSRAELRAG